MATKLVNLILKPLLEHKPLQKSEEKEKYREIFFQVLPELFTNCIFFCSNHIDVTEDSKVVYLADRGDDANEAEIRIPYADMPL
uniref:Uncharacterized protein n=1 Tax=Sphaerodactylus townsendi TaxID=933632 RepID=A0ACB8E7Y2_9SAUR